MSSVVRLADRLDLGATPPAQHGPERLWSETNCYVDLWIELLGRLGADPRPMCAAALAARVDLGQWTFVTPSRSDLGAVYDLRVEELYLWRPVVEHVAELLAAGATATVEVDSYWLPDTAGLGYRESHGKTSIVPVAFSGPDGPAGVPDELVYLHNAGIHRAQGEDVAELFGTDPERNRVTLPLVESVVLPADEQAVRTDHDAALALVERELGRADRDAMAPLAAVVAEAVEWLPGAGPEVFHRWTFGTLRGGGSTAELCADAAGWVGEWSDGDSAAARSAARSAEAFRECSMLAKSLQFRLARAARGRAVDPGQTPAQMAAHWAEGVDALRAAVGG